MFFEKERKREKMNPYSNEYAVAPGPKRGARVLKIPFGASENLLPTLTRRWHIDIVFMVMWGVRDPSGELPYSA